MTAELIKSAARRFGADLVGIAATDALRALPPEDNPLSIFPQARSVIVIGRKVLRGALRGVEQGTEFDNAFPIFGFKSHEDNFLARTTYDLTVWIEAQGFDAVPLFAYDTPGQPVGVAVAPDKPAPNVMLNVRILAQAAGLGEVGLHGLFLTPEYGPRQRFAMLLTDAEVEADTPSKPHLCDDCGVCVGLVRWVRWMQRRPHRLVSQATNDRLRHAMTFGASVVETALCRPTKAVSTRLNGWPRLVRVPASPRWRGAASRKSPSPIPSVSRPLGRVAMSATHVHKAGESHNAFYAHWTAPFAVRQQHFEHKGPVPFTLFFPPILGKNQFYTRGRTASGKGKTDAERQ